MKYTTFCGLIVSSLINFKEAQISSVNFVCPFVTDTILHKTSQIWSVINIGLKKLLNNSDLLFF